MRGMVSAARERRVVTQPSHPFARRMTIAVCVLAVGSGELRAQPLAIPRGANAAQIIANTEADGAAFRRVPNPTVLPTTFMSLRDQRRGADLFGRENEHAEGRTCAAGREIGPIRSGEFVIGGNLSGRAAMEAGRSGKVWWAPLHHGRKMPPLLVTGRSLSAPRDTLRFITSLVARTTGQPPRQYFFPSGIMVPKPGRWLMVATSGANWGCFILTVK